MGDREELFRKIARFLRERGAVSVKVFGSYARGEETPGSDIDILVEFREVPGLLEFVGMQQDLEDLTGFKVHLVTERSLSPHLWPYVESDLIEVTV